MPVEQGVVKARKILHEWDGENPKRFEGWMYGKKYDSVDDWVVDIAAGKIVPDRVELIGFSCRVAIVLHDPPEKGLKRRCSLSFYP